MLKIFLTGDNHIGLHTNIEIHDNRINVFDDMVNEANKEDCDLFVIAGDLFNKNNGKQEKEIKRVFDILSKFNSLVIIIPGNHDYYDKNTRLWDYIENKLNKYDNILILNEYKEYAIKCGDNDVYLYPAFCQTEHSKENENNLNWIKELNVQSDDKIRIGIAHGAVEGETIDKEGKYFLMSKKELNDIPLDVWLIGHTHVPFPNDLSNSFSIVKNKIFNAGTHVQEDVNSDTEGYCFVIEISDDKKIKAKKYQSGNISFKRINLNIKPGELQDKIHNELSKYEDNTIIELILEGSLLMDEYEQRETIIKQELSRFKDFSYRETNLNKYITKQFIDSKFPETSFSAQLLNSLLDNPKETQMMYELLQELKEGKNK